MPWHLSRSDPRKVYDERHLMVCVCNNPDQATLVVRAVNEMHSREHTGFLPDPPIAVSTPRITDPADLKKLVPDPPDAGFAVVRRR